MPSTLQGPAVDQNALSESASAQNADDETLQKNVFTVKASELPVSCPPRNQAQWNLHPRVYLAFGSTDSASCPYCGNQFKLAKE